MSELNFELKQYDLYQRQVRTRMPFRFGKAVLTEMPIIYLRLELTFPSGGQQTGACACGIPPLWFDKDPNTSETQYYENMLTSVRVAVQHLESAGTVGELWPFHREMEQEQRKKCAALGLNPLVTSFGQALVDGALIDALCRRANTSFFRALKSDLFGMGKDFTRHLPEKPTQSMAIRHTVGLGDPIFNTDIEKPLGDGLPQSLEQVIEDYGVRYFKIKVTSDTQAALERLQKIAALLDSKLDDYKVTLDGNEQFQNMESFYRFCETLDGTKALEKLWGHTIWIEEPVTRLRSLEEGVGQWLAKIKRMKPVIMDESGGEDDTVDRALEAGYSGISAKNCKGVFRTLYSFQRLCEYREKHSAAVYLSSEDLTNVPILPLQQDLCVAAALGIEHSERNGHHYIRGFDFLSPKERENALKEFPELYRPVEGSSPVLDIKKGSISTAGINGAFYGTQSHPDWEAMEKRE